MEIDWFLVSMICLVFVILIITNIYLIVHFQHPSDKNEALFPKLLVLMGLTLSQLTILLLPLDVANNSGYAGCDGYDISVCGGLNMEIAWEIVYFSVLAFVVLLIPFAIFYYEADDGMGNHQESQLCSAIKYEFVVLLVSGLSLFLMYFYLATTEIPLTTLTVDVSSTVYLTMEPDTFPTDGLADCGPDDIAVAESATTASTTLNMELTFPIYVSAMLGFVGWFFFVIFCGVGLAALPIDLVCAYMYRPRHMDAIEFAEAQLSVRNRVGELIEIGELLKREREDRKGDKQGFWSKRKGDQTDRKTVNQFKQSVYILEEDVEELKWCHELYHKYNPLIPFGKLLCGILSSLLSLMWIIHVCIFVLPDDPISPFLNEYFVWFDGWFPLFGVLSVMLFSMYLQACVIKGCFKMGVRFFFVSLHPMKVNGTYMNSFLFNLGLILLCSLPIVQFCTIAFSDYARFTNVNQIFGVQVKYLRFFSYFWTTNAFIYAILGMAVLSTGYLLLKPRDTPANGQALRSKLTRRK